MKGVEKAKWGLAAVLAVTVIFGVFPMPGSPAAGGRAPGSVMAYPTTTAPTVDGTVDAGWSSATPITTTENNVELRFLYDSTSIYMLAKWSDTTDSVLKSKWTFDATSGKWGQSGGEDRLGFQWNVNITGFSATGCAKLCHDDGMRANLPNERTDEWHWKSARTNPVGQSDDKWVDNAYDPNDDEAGHHGDAKTSGGYSDNKKTLNFTDDPANSTSVPKYYEPGATGDDAKVILGTEVSAGETRNITAVWKDGNLTDATGTNITNTTVIPGYVVAPFVGSRGDLETKAVWNANTWTLELKRKLVTGNSDDVQFNITQKYNFGVATFDAVGGSDHVTSDTVYELSFWTPAHVVPANAKADRSSALIGDTVTVTLNLTNDGTAASTGESLTLLSGTTELANATLNVAGGGAVTPGTIAWNTTGAAAGSHTLTVRVKSSGLTASAGTVTLIAPTPHVYLKSVAAAPATAKPGDTVTVTATLRNDGTADAVSAEVNFYLDNSTTSLGKVAVNVSKGNATDAAAVFTWATADAAPGSHTIKAVVKDTGLTGTSGPVQVLTKASISITSMTSSKTSLKDQPKDSAQKVTLSITLANSGESGGTVLLVVKEKDKVLDSRNVTLDGGKNATVTVTWAIKGEGKHTATAAITGAGTGSKTADVSMTYKSPGFEVVALLASVGVAAILLGRKRRN